MRRLGSGGAYAKPFVRGAAGDGNASASEEDDAWLFDERNQLSGEAIPLRPVGASARKHRADSSSDGAGDGDGDFPSSLRRAGSAFAPDVSVTSLYGVIAENSRPLLERMLIRSARGNVYIAHDPIKNPVVDPETLQPVRKCVFRLIFPPGSQLPGRARRVCAALGAHLYSPPAETLSGLQAALSALHKERRARLVAVRQTRQALRRSLYAAVWGVTPGGAAAAVAALGSPAASAGADSDGSDSETDGDDAEGVFDEAAAPRSEGSASDVLARAPTPGTEMDAAPAAHAVFAPLSAATGADAAAAEAAALAATAGVAYTPTSASPLNDWFVALRQEQELQSLLSLARRTQAAQSLSLAGWVPTTRLEALRSAVRTAAAASGAADATVAAAVVEVLLPAAAGCRSAPPTLIATTALTAVPQSVVDTYGVPKYKEVNPGLFTVVTFPFLFGVMYGDVFHGGCLFLAGLLLVLMQVRALLQS